MLNDFPSSESTLTDNQVLLYINEAMSFGIVGTVWGGAKVTGVMEVPDAYQVTFQLEALQQDNVTKRWYSTMPQPPLSLPLGYSVNSVYFANSSNGKGLDCFPVKNKRTGYRKFLPSPLCVFYSVENSRIWLEASDGSSLLNEDCYIQMPSTRAISVNDPMNLPDDATDAIFTKVTARLKERLMLPQDTIQDDLPPGNKGN
jgi:hypothetical protein